MTPEQHLFTVGQIADQLTEPVSRVAYIIQKYRIRPVSRVGIIRLFSSEQMELMRQGLYGIQIRGDRYVR